jgi:hypothetical protein
MDKEKAGGSQSGGVRIDGRAKVTVGGSIVGGDMTVTNYGQMSNTQLNEIFRPIQDAVQQAAPEKQGEAAPKVEALKSEAAKGEKANDGVMATLINGIVKLAPGAVSAVASAFGTPLLGGIAGPVTKIVLKDLGLGS